MTGCFGALDNADAEENTSETIVNNYYNNTTTIIDTPVIEKFAVGGVFAQADYPTDSSGYSVDEIHSFNTTAGEIILIHFFDANQVQGGYILSECTDSSSGGSNQYYLDDDGTEYLWGAHSDCTHKVRLMPQQSQDEFAFSLIYSIESVTVV